VAHVHAHTLARATAPPTADRRSSAALVAGMVAGPLFIITASIQGFLRDGFDISRHPFSALSVGDYGWVQITNFLVAGALVVAASIGVGRALPETGRVRTGAWLIAAHGVGLIGAGVFTTDAADGFPVGTPEGLPDTFSWHAIVHGVVTPAAFVAILAATLVLAVPLGVRFGHRWRVASRTVPIAVVVAMLAPGLGGFSLRLAIASALVMGWLVAVAGRCLAAGDVDPAHARSASTVQATT
jgi:Protein of unknown function (DUF998)